MKCDSPRYAVERHKPLAWPGKCRALLERSHPNPGHVLFWRSQHWEGDGGGNSSWSVAQWGTWSHSKASAATCSNQEHQSPARPHCFIDLHKALGSRARELPMAGDTGSAKGTGSPPPAHLPLPRRCSPALPGHSAFKLLPQGPTENNKRIVSFPTGSILICTELVRLGEPFPFISSLTVFLALDVTLAKQRC